MKKFWAIPLVVLAAISASLPSAARHARGAHTPSAGNSNLYIGANLGAGGGGSYQMVLEGFPIWKNRAREALYYKNYSGSAPVALTTAGWPAADFQIQLTSAPYSQAWLTNGVGYFTCGFVGTGSETVTVNGGYTIAPGTVNHGTGGAYTTFNVTDTSIGGGILVSGTTGGVTNFFCNLPEYPATTVDNPISSNAFTAEAISYYSQFKILRFMEWTNAIRNEAVMTSTNRYSATTAQIQASTSSSNALTINLTGTPANGATTATLSAAWPYPYTVVSIYIPYSGGLYSRLASFTQGSTAISWASGGGALPTAGNAAYFYAGLGDDYPYEWAVAFATVCGNSLWFNLPLFEDGTNYAAGSYTQAFLTYLQANWTNGQPVYLEITNEIFNTHTGAMNNAASVLGFAGSSQYQGYKLHALANAARTYAPGLWAAGQIRIVYAGQYATTGGGVYAMSGVLGYMQTNYGAPSADLYAYADAPYWTPVVGSSDSVATIEANIAAAEPADLYTHGAENTYIMASHYGLVKMSYEGGQQWNSVSTTNTNAGAAIVDTSGGYQSAMNSYYQNVLSSGYQQFVQFKAGVYMGASAATAPTDQPTYTWTGANSAPTMLSMQSFYGGFTPLRNVVTSPGGASTVSGGNYADTASGGSPYLGQANAYQTGPYYGVSGYLCYLLNVETTGSYTFTAYLTTTTTGHTNFEVTGGNILATGISISSGLAASPVTLGTTTLQKGTNYTCLGNGTTQSGIKINYLEISQLRAANQDLFADTGLAEAA